MCLKLEDDLRKHNEYKSNLLKLVALKTEIAAFQWGLFQLGPSLLLRIIPALTGVERHLSVEIH